MEPRERGELPVRLKATWWRKSQPTRRSDSNEGQSSGTHMVATQLETWPRHVARSSHTAFSSSLLAFAHRWSITMKQGRSG